MEWTLDWGWHYLRNSCGSRGWVNESPSGRVNGFYLDQQVGTVEGNIARVEVEYAGVTGIIQAELVDEETAIAFAATCAPEFMVVCALAKDQQATFKKMLAN